MRMRTMRADDSDQLTGDSVGETTPRRGSLVNSRLSGGLAPCIFPRNRRRGSAVTFDLPDDSEEEEEKNFRKICGHRRMSAPELPPISDRSDSKTRTSSGSGKERNGFYQRIRNGRLPRNHSEGSIKGILARSPNSQSSSSLNSITGGNSVLTSAKTRSHCGTEKSTGSTTKLRTLFEKKPELRASSPTRDSGSGYRSTSTDRGLSKSNFRLGSELNNNSEEVLSIEQVENGRVLRRNQSENQLTDHLKKRRNSQNIISVGKMDTLTKSKTKNGYNVPKLKRYNSTPVINRSYTMFTDKVSETTLKTKDLQNGNDSENDNDKDLRILEWLRKVDEFHPDAPPEQIIDYCGEPPQTDTAVHIVYNDGNDD